MKPLKINLFQEIKDYLIITFGLLCYAIGFDCFQLPYGIVGGGVAGFGSIVFFGTGFPVQYTFFIINGILLLAAVKVLGWKFCVKTIYGVFMLTFFLGVVKEAMEYYGTLNPHLNGTYNLPLLVDDNKFMAALFAAGIEAMGLAFVFLHNGSTGGTDIIAAMINKYKDVTLGQMMMLCDIFIVSSCMVLPDRTLPDLLYGFTVLFTLNIMVDYLMDRSRQSVQFLIISREYEEIAAAINACGRGVTVLNGTGWYTKNESKVLLVLARKRESANLFQIIQGIDPKAFVSQSKVLGVFGEGFDRIKVKAKNKTEKSTSNPS
ncbi:MAG: YitT family protein [Bacteroidaceae bacterium]|nr:YitT family protein [Bacteroidaceae bacterium]